jgi:hypothetical protein
MGDDWFSQEIDRHLVPEPVPDNHDPVFSSPLDGLSPPALHVNGVEFTPFVSPGFDAAGGNVTVPFDPGGHGPTPIPPDPAPHTDHGGDHVRGFELPGQEFQLTHPEVTPIPADGQLHHPALLDGHLPGYPPPGHEFALPPVVFPDPHHDPGHGGDAAPPPEHLH